MKDGTDLIVVGAGAAGAVIAARVTESTAHEVTLIEAGPDYGTGSLPADLNDGTRNSLVHHDWGYRHRPTTQQVVFPLPRGKVVGGSSAVNTCIALRGVPSDYDEWAALGLDDWSWEKCLPAFKRLETDLDFKNEWHGDHGPIPIRRHPKEELTPWHGAFLEACTEVGYPATPDHNHPKAHGHGPHAMNKIRGERMNAARCYLDARTRARPNLRILAETTLRRVLFDNRRVIGVEVERGGQIERILAPRVVLSAGAIATPGILLRSGIGPAGELARLGVPLLSDLPAVGARLLDHPGAAFFLAPKRGVVDLAGPLIQTALRLRSPGSEHDNDVQIQAGMGMHFPTFSLPLVSLMCQVCKPRGSGVLHFPSADPHVAPQIDSRLLEHPDDRAHAVRSLGLALELADRGPLRSLATPIIPPASVLRRRSWLEGIIRRISDSGYHPSGTAPMGREGDPRAATDGRGRVRGVEGLIVADASLMPTIPTANTHLPTLMIGERFGEWLREGQI
jgi:choline dehydrogenase